MDVEVGVFIFAIIFVVFLLFRLSRRLLSSVKPYSVRKGEEGERIISELLKDLPVEYHIMNDVMIAHKKGSTQIDHIVVSPFGVFVIETKNYKGKIIGNDNRSMWTQLISSDYTYHNGKTYTYVNKYQIYNPVRQSRNHALQLSKILSKYPQLPIIPVLVFVGDSDIENIVSRFAVLRVDQLIPFILGHKQSHLSNMELDSVVKLLELFNTRDFISEEYHMESVKKSREEYTQKINDNICPNCGGYLVLRRGSYGEFLGCSNYPRCKFTHKL